MSKQDIIKNAIKTDTLVSVANQIQPENTTLQLPEFEDMTKIQLGDWALENLGLQINLRFTKSKIIETIKKNL